MRGFQKDFSFFVKRFWFIVPLLIVAAIGYGFHTTNFTIGIDTLARERYIFGGYSFKIGRFTLPVLARLLHFESTFPFAEPLFSLLLLIAAAIALCIVFKRVSGDKLHPAVYTIFACIFISYPLISEIWIYAMMNWSVALGYLLISIACLVMLDWIREKQKFWKLIVAALIMAVVTSLYESLLTVYVCLVFLILIVEFIFGTDDTRRFGRIALRGLFFVIPLVAGMLLQYGIGELIIKTVPGLPNMNVAANKIQYPKLGVEQALKNVFEGIYKDFIAKSSWYLPMTMFMIACIVLLVIAIVNAIRQKRFSIYPLFLGALLSLFIIGFIQGEPPRYRNCQAFALFVATAFTLLAHFTLQMKKGRFLKGLVSCLLIWLCLIQAVDLNNWFVLGHRRYEQEKELVHRVAYELQANYDIQKPVVIYTQFYEWPSNVNLHDLLASGKTMAQQDLGLWLGHSEGVRSVIRWGVNAFNEPNTELLKVFKYLGYDFKQGTRDMYNQAQAISGSMPSFPKEGSIRDMGNFIIVKLP